MDTCEINIEIGDIIKAWLLLQPNTKIKRIKHIVSFYTLTDRHESRIHLRLAEYHEPVCPHKYITHPTHLAKFMEAHPKLFKNA